MSENKKRPLSLSRSKTGQNPLPKRQKRPLEVDLGIEKYPPGLANPGNCCFLNSLLQCLFHNASITETLQQVFTTHSNSCDELCSSTAGHMCCVKAMQMLLQDFIYRHPRRVSPQPMLLALRDVDASFRRGEQADAHEFYLKLISAIHEKKFLKQKSMFDDFFIEETVTVQCSKCQTATVLKSPKSACIQLYPMSQPLHIQDLFSQYFEEELVTANCKKCNMDVTKSKTSQVNAPKMLCIHVFKDPSKAYQPTMVQVQKSWLKIPQRKDGVYQLTGLIVHTQLSPKLGHYTAFVRSNHSNNQWFYVNDSQVVQVSVATVLLQKPYMLFYSRVSSEGTSCNFPLSMVACQRLRSTSYLNDEIIDQYLQMISKEAFQTMNKKVAVFSSQFTTKLRQHGEHAVSSWRKKCSISEQDLLVFSIHESGNHWTLLIVDMHKKTAEYYDSFSWSHSTDWRAIKSFLESQTKAEIDWNKWTYLSQQSIPKQDNGFDCGVFTCQYALHRVREVPLLFKQEHIGLIRKIMLEELLSGQLWPHKYCAKLLRQPIEGMNYYDHDTFLEPLSRKYLHHKDIKPVPAKHPEIMQCIPLIVSNTKAQPDHLTSIQPNCPTAIPVDHPTAIQPNLSTAIQPNLSTTIQPNYLTAIQPNLPTAIQPNVPAAIQPNLPTAIQPNLPTTIQPPNLLTTIRTNLPTSNQPKCPIAIELNQIEQDHPTSIEPDLPNSIKPTSIEPDRSTAIELDHPNSDHPTSIEPDRHRLTTIKPDCPTSIEPDCHRLEPNHTTAIQLDCPTTEPKRPISIKMDHPTAIQPCQPYQPGPPTVQHACISSLSKQTAPYKQRFSLTQPLSQTSAITPQESTHNSTATSYPKTSSRKRNCSTSFLEQSYVSPPSSPTPPPYSPIQSSESERDTEAKNMIKVCLNQETPGSNLHSVLQSIFPVEYTYIFQTFIQHPDNKNVSFTTKFFINSKSETSAKQWISELETLSGSKFRITKGTRTKGLKILYKTCRHCQHKRKKSNKPRLKSKAQSISGRDKKTGCLSSFILKVHAATKQNTKIKQTHPCEVNLHWEHNHSTHSAHALSFKPISEDVKTKFYNYFSQGHSPSSAKQFHTMNLLVQYNEQILADRELNPLSRDVYYLFSKWRTETYGKQNGEYMFGMLEKKVEEYNTTYKKDGGQAALQKYDIKHKCDKTWDSGLDNQPLILALCTPLMSRAHTMLRQAGELIFVDATSSLDQYNCPTFIVSTCSAAGAIPLGVVITSGEDEETITEALTVLKTVLPQEAFFGRGLSGPQMCITDDSTAERSAIHRVWPDTELYLCIFHFLQSWWAWLWSGDHNILKQDRPLLMKLIKQLVFTKSEESLNNRYFNLIDTSDPDSYSVKYPQFVKHLEAFWDRKLEWALSFRITKVFRNNHTNNYAEASIRIIKEIIFGRVKAFNLIQMFEFFSCTLEKYYANRLLDIAHSRYRPGICTKFKKVFDTKSISKTEQISDSIYWVTETAQGEDYDFLVDIELSTCSCLKGARGTECKHQAAIAKINNTYIANIPPFFSKHARRVFAILAVGKHSAMELDFYADLRDDSSTPIGQESYDQIPLSHNSEIVDAAHCNSGNDNLSDGDDESLPQPNEWSEIVADYKVKLTSVVDDLVDRLHTGDAGILSGVRKFLSAYDRLQNSYSPSPAIAHSLHLFGKDERNTWSSRYGKRIKVNPTGIRRRRKFLSRGNKLAPQGRPTVWKWSKQSLIKRNTKKPRKPHSLAFNIAMNQRN